jgi:AcrR family transcriptional regulator
VLAEQGVAGCTVREVAAAGPLTKSSIHYYFADMDVLVDLAMSEHVAAFEAQLRAAGAATPDPLAAFWTTIEAYLATFRDRPNVAHLWFEYWIDAVRKGRLDAVTRLHEQITDVLTERLRALDVPSPDDRGRAVFVYLVGAIIDEPVSTETHERIRRDIAALAGIGLA